MSYQIQMLNTPTKVAPFKMNLKRTSIANHSSEMSTHYKTNQSQRQTLQKIKSFTPRYGVLNQRSSFNNNPFSVSLTQRTHQEERPQKDQNIDTSQISALISLNIKNDQNLFERDLIAIFRSQSYQLAISKVVTKEPCHIPKMIYQAYQLAEKQKSSHNQKVNFCQGYLEKANIIYYVVQRQMFLFNGEQFSNLETNKICSYKKVVLKNILFKIYQITFNTTLLQGKIQDKILIFSYPYQIQFCTYENSSKSSQIKLIDLQFTYGLDTKKGQFFQNTIDGKIIYLDNYGKLNYISTEGIVFSLTEYVDRQSMQIMKKTIKAFKLANSNFIPIWSILQQQILEYVASRTFFKSKYMTIGINDICKVEKNYIKDSNLMLVLKNFTRVYLNITQDNVTVSQIIYAPQFSSLQAQSNLNRQNLDNKSKKFNSIDKTPSNHIQDKAIINFQKQLNINQKQSPQTYLKSFYHKNNIIITLVHNQNNVYSLFYNRQTGQSQNEKLMNIAWKIQQKKQSQLPILQNYFYKINDRYMMEPENILLLSNDKQICNSYEFLRQVFYPPLYYYYCTDLFVQKFFLLRPIDVLFTVIYRQDFYVCLKILPKLFSNVSLKQICVMLIQIQTNQQGFYYVSQNFNQSIENILKRYFLKTISRHSQVGQRITEQKNKKRSISNNVTKVQFKSISKQIIGLIEKLFYEFSSQNFIGSTCELEQLFSKIDFNSNRNQLPKQLQINKKLLRNKFESSILYISRIYHPLWNKIIQQIDNKQNNSFIRKIKSLKKMNMLLKNYSNQQMAILMLEGFFQKSVQILNLINIIKNLPQITFQECFQKDSKFFEEYIFKAIDKFYQLNILSKIQKLFSIYVSNYFRRILKIYEEVKNINSRSKIMQLLKQQPSLPKYFIQYLVNIRQMHQAQIFRVQKEISVITTKLRIPNNLTRQGQINFIFQQIQKGYQSLNQKLYFLQLAQQKIQKLIQDSKRFVNYNHVIIVQMRQTHQQLSYCLKLQRLMKLQYLVALQNNEFRQKKNQFKWLLNFFSQVQKPKEVQDQILNEPHLQQKKSQSFITKTEPSQIINCLLHSIQLKPLVNDHLQIEWQKLLLMLKEKTQLAKGDDKSLQRFSNQIRSVIRDIVEITKKKLNIKIMMNCIDKHFYGSVSYMHKLKSRKNGVFLLGCYLADLNCDQLDIKCYYYEIMQQYTVNEQKMYCIDVYFYIWFNFLQFIKRFSKQNVRKFAVISQEYIQLSQKRNIKCKNEKTQITVMKIELKDLQS